MKHRYYIATLTGALAMAGTMAALCQWTGISLPGILMGGVLAYYIGIVVVAAITEPPPRRRKEMGEPPIVTLDPVEWHKVLPERRHG